MGGGRTALKRVLATTGRAGKPGGTTILTYHRVGGPGRDELDVSSVDFARQLDVLAEARVDSLDAALDALDAGDRDARVVLTFDDGFRDVFDNAWPLLRERHLPFTLYLATAYLDGVMMWQGSTASDQGAPALSWAQVEEMVESGLCTVGNHTHTHVRPEQLSERELDRCSEAVQARIGHPPRHFAYPWGVPVPGMSHALRSRFRSAVTGEVGRNGTGADPFSLRRVPVRRTDPLQFFRSKVAGGLLPELLYGAVVSTAKRAGAHA